MTSTKRPLRNILGWCGNISGLRPLRWTGSTLKQVLMMPTEEEMKRPGIHLSHTPRFSPSWPFPRRRTRASLGRSGQEPSKMRQLWSGSLFIFRTGFDQRHAFESRTKRPKWNGNELLCYGNQSFCYWHLSALISPTLGLLMPLHTYKDKIK